MLGLKLIHVRKRGPWHQDSPDWTNVRGLLCQVDQIKITQKQTSKNFTLINPIDNTSALACISYLHGIVSSNASPVHF